MYKDILIIGRGIGQVMFQNNALSGGLMLIGIIYNSWLLAILAIAGTITSTVTATFSNYDKEDIRNGLYGFNGTLVGIAIGTFMKINFISILLLIIGSVLSTWIARWFRYQKYLSGLTAPFILVVWLLLIICTHLYPSLLCPSSPEKTEPFTLFFQSFCLNISQVMFQGDHILPGILFLSGILINSRLNAVYAIIGATLPLFIALHPNFDITAWNAGLFGYNGVLCAIAIGDKTQKRFIKALFSIILSIILQTIGIKIGMITLTAPFVCSVWITNLLFTPKKNKIQYQAEYVKKTDSESLKKQSS